MQLRNFKLLIKHVKDLSIFDEKYGSTEKNFSLADLLWVCSDIMATAPKFSAKRIFLITDNDDPVAKNPAYKKASIQRAKVYFYLHFLHQNLTKCYIYLRT